MSPKKIILRFGKDISTKPVIYHLAKDFDLVFNILKASVDPYKEGVMVMELTGEKYEQGLEFLKQEGVRVQPLAEEVSWNQEICTSCGACTDICPTGALHINRPSMEVEFESDNCIICKACVTVCPVRAMEVKF